LVEPADQFGPQLWITAEADTISDYDIILRFDPQALSLVEAIERSLYVKSGFEAEKESPDTWEVFHALGRS
jgi:hypothetical protein